jgi:hypothetical protein
MPAPSAKPGGGRKSSKGASAAAAAAAAPRPAAAAPPQQQQLKSIGLQLRNDSSLISYIFLKAHQPREDDHSQQQQQQQQQAAAGTSGQQQLLEQQQVARHAVFAAGLPLGLTEEDLEAVLSCFGDVAQVVLHHTKVRCAFKHAGLEPPC